MTHGETSAGRPGQTGAGIVLTGKEGDTMRRPAGAASNGPVSYRGRCGAPRRLHQFSAVLQSTGSVDQENVAAALLGRAYCIESETRGVGACLTRNEIGAAARRPDF